MFSLKIWSLKAIFICLQSSSSRVALKQNLAHLHDKLLGRKTIYLVLSVYTKALVLPLGVYCLNLICLNLYVLFEPIHDRDSYFEEVLIFSWKINWRLLYILIDRCSYISTFQSIIQIFVIILWKPYTDAAIVA